MKSLDFYLDYGRGALRCAARLTALCYWRPA